MPDEILSQDWLPNLIYGNETTRRAISQSLLQLSAKDRREALANKHRLLADSFARANPCDNTFPLQATLEFLRDDSEVSPDDYFTFLRLHAVCVGANIQETIIALWHALEAQNTSLARTFISFAKTDKRHKKPLHKYLLDEHNIALQYIKTKKRNIIPENEKTMFFDWREAQKRLAALKINSELNLDEIYELLDLVPPRAKEQFTAQNLVNFLQALKDPNIDEFYKFALIDVVYSLYPYFSPADLQRLTTSALQPLLIRELNSAKPNTYIVASIAPFVGANFRSQKAGYKLADKLLEHYLTVSSRDAVTIGNGWGEYFESVDFMLTSEQQQQVLEHAMRNVQTDAIFEGAARIMFSHYLRSNDALCEQSLDISQNKYRPTKALSHLINFAQSLYLDAANNKQVESTCKAPSINHRELLESYPTATALNTHTSNSVTILAAAFLVLVTAMLMLQYKLQKGLGINNPRISLTV